MHSQNIRIRTYQCIELPCYKIACSKYIKVKPFWLRFFSVAFHYTHSNSLYKIKWKKKKTQNFNNNNEESKSNRPFGRCELKPVQNECTKLYTHTYGSVCVCALSFGLMHFFRIHSLFYTIFFCVSTLTKKERQMKLFWERPTKR